MKWSIIPSLAVGAVGLTAPTISVYASVYLTTEQVGALAFPGAELTQITVVLNREEQKQLKKIAGGSRAFNPEAIFKVSTGGWMVVDRVIGKHEFITYAVALDTKGNVKQVEILEYRETYGGAVRGQTWRSQFVGKNNQSMLQLTKDIDNISGATLSSKNLTDGVRRITRFYAMRLAQLN